jgi:hypothetical protein
MTNKELLRELRELRMLLNALHSDARGNGHGPCTCKTTGPVCGLHSQVRQHLLNATNSLRDAVILLNESMISSK